MSIWVLAYYLYYYAQREINATKEGARLAIVAKDAQLNQLTAQLNPHFFFNSLNNIKALVDARPERSHSLYEHVQLVGNSAREAESSRL
jgi:LytS/YehU family sensor histidine kinase